MTAEAGHPARGEHKARAPRRTRSAAAHPEPEAGHVVAGNRLRLLTEGPARLEALEELIDRATRSLRLLYYIFSTDTAGTRVRDALTRAAGRGVTVALIVDGFGSAVDDDFLAPLRAAGAEVCRFLPHWGRRYLLRNHQKLALADGESEGARALIGGFNVEDDYFGTGGDAWRDLGLLIEGPAARRITRYFDRLHAWTGRPDATIRALRRTLNGSSETQGEVRWLIGGPTRSLSPWARAVKREMHRAARLDILAAYFAPNPAMLRTIERVAKRGGEARVITAARSDNSGTVMAARHTYASLLKRGVRVFEYQAAKLHSKLFVIDDVVHIGSANFDIRSLYLNCELMLRIEDKAFADALRAHVAHEIADSREITHAAHRATRVIDRVRWTFAYFMVAIVDGNVSRRLNFGPDGR